MRRLSEKEGGRERREPGLYNKGVRVVKGTL